jgi:hypothetical protein
LSRPERPNSCKAALRAASVPSRITCETRTSLRRRSGLAPPAVVIEAVTGKERDATRSQGLSQRVKNHVGHMLGARTQTEHRNNLRAGIHGQPEPQHLCGVAQPGAEFVQLEVREPEMTEGALMEDLSMPTCTSEKGS